MKRGKFGLVLLIIIVFMVMVGGIIWVGSSLTKNTANRPAANVQEKQVKVLDQPKADTVLSLTARGPITAQEERYFVSMTITQTSRKLYVYQGYANKVVGKIELDNQPQAFADLLLALKNNGFADTVKTNADKNAAICANGQLIEFNLKDGQKDVVKSWVTSCGVGTFAGNSQPVIDLIQRQFPGGKKLISKTAQNIVDPNAAPQNGLNFKF